MYGWGCAGYWGQKENGEVGSRNGTGSYPMNTYMEFDNFLTEVSTACGNREEGVILLGNEEMGENFGELLKLKLDPER